MEQQELGSPLPLSHHMLLLANPSREGEALPTAATLAGICSACRWVKRGECCFLSALMAFPDKWGCFHHPACESRAPSWLGCSGGVRGTGEILVPCGPYLSAQHTRGAAVLQEHSCLQQDSLGSAACQIPWLPRGLGHRAHRIQHSAPPGISGAQSAFCAGALKLYLSSAALSLCHPNAIVFCAAIPPLSQPGREFQPGPMGAIAGEGRGDTDFPLQGPWEEHSENLAARTR